MVRHFLFASFALDRGVPTVAFKAHFTDGLGVVAVRDHVGAQVALNARYGLVEGGVVDSPHAVRVRTRGPVAAARARRAAVPASGAAATRRAERARARLVSQATHLVLGHRRVHHRRHRVLQ